MKRKIQVFIVLITVLLLLFNLSCKSSASYNIVGTWSMTYYIFAIPVPAILIFLGTMDEGTVTSPLFGNVGSYTVTGDEVDFNGKVADGTGNAIIITATGTMASSSQMSGTFIYYDPLFPNLKFNGNWSGIKQ